MVKNNLPTKIILAALLTAASLSAAGCKSNDTAAAAKVETGEMERDSDVSDDKDSSEKTKSTSKSEETELEKKFGKKASFQQLQALIDAMAQNDSDAILEMLKLPENSVVTADDVSYFLARSELSPFLEVEGTEAVDFEEASGKASGKIKNGSDAAIINLALNDDNQWVPVVEGLYLKDMPILAVGKAEITFNGCKMDESRFAETDTTSKDGTVIYTLTVPNKPFKVVTNSSFFGTLESEITPGTSDKYNARPELSAEYLAEAQNGFKDILTSMLADAKAGVTDVSAYQKYFSDQADTELMAAAVSGIQGMVKEGGEVVCTEVVSRPGSAPSMVIADNRCVLNMGYKLSFTYHGAPADQKRVSWVMIDKKEDGTYGIFKTGDTKIFSELNPYIQQY